MKHKYKNILFDLDGTLVDSSEGITKGVQYALREKVHIIEEDLNSLLCFIGPPLAVMLDQKYHIAPELIEPTISKYREYYDTTGVYECTPFPGVVEILQHLNQKGYIIGLGSSKPEDACEMILRYHHLDQYIDYIVGASRGPERREKVMVLQEAIRRMQVNDLSRVVLIGDTKYDVIGANKAGIDCIGVTFGFGTREELIEAGALAVFDTMEEVEAYLDAEV